MTLFGKRVCVAGGSGFLGTHLCRRLSESGAHVTTLDSVVHGEAPLLPGVPLTHGDARWPEHVDAALAGQDAVFFLATRNVRLSLRDPWTVAETNVAAALACAQAAARAGVKRYVYVSSSEALGDALLDPMSEDHPTNPTTVYGATKLAGEHITTAVALATGLPAVIVRPFNAIGPGAHVEGDAGEVVPRWINRCLRGEPLTVHGDGLQARDFTWAPDLADGMSRAAECDALVGAGPIHLASGRAVTMLELAEAVIRAVGVPTRVEHTEPRPGDLRRQRGGAGKAACLLGWSPTVTLEEAVARTAAWVRERGAVETPERTWA